MKRTVSILLCFILLFSGCVSQSDYDEMSDELNESLDLLDDLQAELQQINDEINQKNASIKSLQDQLSSNEDELTGLNETVLGLEASLSAAEQELDELKNGAAHRLVKIRNAYDAEEWQNVIDLSAELHREFNGFPEDAEAQLLATASADNLAEIERLKKEEEDRLAAEAAKTAQEKAREIIRVTKISAGSPNSAGGVDLFIGYKNMSDKVIKYATFTIVPYNGVGDRVTCDIRGYSTFNARDDGPHAKNEGIAGNYNWYWENAWYNWSIKTLVLERIYIEYMDGTTATLRGDDIGYVRY